MSLELDYGEDVFCDLQEIGCYLRRQNPEVSIRFIEAARLTCEFLSSNPYLGRPRPEFQVEGLRSWVVKEFARYLVFYVPTATQLKILRILSGSRDLSAEFNQ